MIRTVLALYEDAQTAISAVEALANSGFDSDQISMVANDVSKAYAQSSQKQSKNSSDANKLADMHTGQIAGIGPVVAAGPLASSIFSDTRDDSGSIIEGLTDLGARDTDAQFWAEGVRRGGALVGVDVEADEDVTRAENILNQFDMINIEERGKSYQDTGWKAFDATAKPYTEQEVNDFRTQVRDIPAGQQQKLDVVEEELQVGKREVQGKTVRVNTRITERPVQADVTLRNEQVTIERHAVDRPASVDDLNAFQEATIELTETHEEAVVGKTARVVEEVIVGKRADEHTETINETVRRKDVEVQNVEAGSRSYSDYQTQFRTGFDTRYAKQGTWEEYDPAYHFGYDLVNKPQYSGYDWNRVEADAQKQWEAQSPNTWDRFKGAIRDAWESVTGQK